MTNPFDVGNSGGLGRTAAFPSVSLKASLSAAIVAEPGFETSEVRISLSAGYVVLEGYVSDVEQIGKVFEIAELMAGAGRVKNFLFHRS